MYMVELFLSIMFVVIFTPINLFISVRLASVIESFSLWLFQSVVVSNIISILAIFTILIGLMVAEFRGLQYLF